MADLISLAYNSNITKVIGGPSWLEMDKFDVTARQPTAELLWISSGSMLRALLGDRFQLVAKEESRPMPSFALVTSNGKHKMKEADGPGISLGCRPQNSRMLPTRATQGPRIMMARPEGGNPIEIAINGRDDRVSAAET